ncbi:putative phage protein gp47/JayE [Paraburkholderia sp. BL23I1N1]|uniref:baseplate J/gp47 family protein n=1 Tax=Paraburkholderia sp. BL23I1N1 TaxID=1938802 RepID=UPI000E75466C|nr:baseplate J/gp47 family protein [Paraburkholderia sp. BL23I1N1]RKE35302.1 putative phage protein gp47/JayE [Paraburkholderia sp. BL23I1N1]
MPFSRPTLSALRTQIWTDIRSAVGLTVSLLQKAVLKIVGSALAALVFGLYGYLDWIAKQAVPFTSTDEFLAGWGALKSVYLEAATQTQLTVQFTGTAPTDLPAGTGVNRTADGFAYVTMSDAVVSGTTVTVNIQAVTAGSAGNCDVGTSVSLASAVTGIQSSGTVTATARSGTDVEEQDDFRDRVMLAFQDPVQGGAQTDYVKWARNVAGVTRAWCSPNGFGAGTVVVYFMMDNAESEHAGFPQGTNGVSQFDEGPGGTPRDVVATGDQLTVADAIVSQQPVTALVYACAPIENQIGFRITGVTSTSTQTAIDGALADLMIREGAPAITIDLSDVNSAIGSVPGSSGYLIEAITSTVGSVTTTYPANTNITNATGQLPVLGNVDWV